MWDDSTIRVDGLTYYEVKTVLGLIEGNGHRSANLSDAQLAFVGVGLSKPPQDGWRTATSEAIDHFAGGGGDDYLTDRQRRLGALLSEPPHRGPATPRRGNAPTLTAEELVMLEVLKATP